MTEQNDKDNKVRSKLTLKLKPAISGEVKASPEPVESKIQERRSGLVQVTIKGRKPTPTPNDSILNKREIESRQNVVNNLSGPVIKDLNSHAILSKINRERIELENKKQDLLKLQVKEDKEVAPEAIIEKSEIKSEEKTPSVYNVDHFDVRKKIRHSLDITNRQKEDREKLVEERKKKEEAEKLEKERVEREKKLKPKKFFKEVLLEEDSTKKPDKSFKDRKGVKKQTYIIGDEDSGSYYKRRKDKFSKQNHSQKDYVRIIKEVILPELISVSELADRMAEKTGDVVKKLFTMGVVATSNQVIDAETAEIIISEFGHTFKKVASDDVESTLVNEDDDGVEKLDRAPIVTIMGHVDHGKTSLLDALRLTDIVKGEHGGITQHIGASRVKTKSGKYITFLDTPGHEAFTAMRSRGANITDIVVLVVAADDGVKEQTVEAINHAKAAGVPIIVAVNKIDKPGADQSKVKNELLIHSIVAEDLGGDVMFIPVSAKQKLNLDKLEEAILLQAEILELKAPYATKASGVVLESRIDPSKGVVTTILVQKGTLYTSDIIVAGTSYGKVKRMVDDKAKILKLLTPSMSAEILGLDNAPSAGDKFFTASEEKQARDIISYRVKKEREGKALKNAAKSIDEIFKASGKEGLKYLNIIVKGDVNGSVEAIVGSLSKLNTEEVAIKVIHSATGGITENDVSLANTTGAIVIGFNVRANSSAKELASVKNTDIRYYSIIYNVVDDIRAILSGMLDPSQNEEYLGQAQVRQVFKVSHSVGKIAGSQIIDGVVKRGAKVRVLRDNIVVFDGTLKTLRRFKDDVKEVKSGFECGLALENFDDIQEGDLIECYQVIESKRQL